MLNVLDDCEWESAFNEAMKDIRAAPPGSDVSTKEFFTTDVASILGIHEGERDEEDWQVAGQLGDHRWFYLSAGCDYTGWD